MNLTRIGIALAITLAVVLLFRSFGSSGESADNLGHFLWAAMAVTLVGSGVLHHYSGEASQAVVHLLIWLAIIAAVAFAYQYKSVLGF
ncbi:MAG TPA: hypothetical protein PKW21_15375 [Rhabdaerophilum sp.]|nr:hypothetical protein [Rhabdaerophilum sp.]